MTRQGFTLAELMIALLLTAIAMGIVAEGVRRSLDFQSRIAEVRTEREARTAGLSALRGRLERLVPLTAEAADGGQGDAAGSGEAVLFSGTANELRFVAADPAYPSTPGLYAYRIRVETPEADSAQVYSVILQRQAIHDFAEFDRLPGAAENVPLFTSAVQPAFAYAEGEGGWRAAWTREDAFPAHVRLAFEGGAAAPLIVALPRAAPHEAEDGDDGAATPDSRTITQ